MALEKDTGLVDSEIARIRACLCERIAGVLAVYLFGSRASGDARPDSDVDLAVLGRAPIPARQRLAVSESLSEALGRDVDLVDLRSASAVLRSQIVAGGRPIYRCDDAEVTAFEDFVFADYARLNEERAGILDDIRARGSVYGG